jgi:hypothetical protein
VSAIQVSPGNIDWDGVTITESLTFDAAHSSCPINGFFDKLCDTGVTGGASTFTVGKGGSELGFTFPAQHNVFYDEHLFGAAVSVLDAPEIPPSLNSCTASCRQQYFCEGNLIGTFTVTRTFTRGTINGQNVTNITISKQ